jgi:hypothetical protein
MTRRAPRLRLGAKHSTLAACYQNVMARTSRLGATLACLLAPLAGTAAANVGTAARLKVTEQSGSGQGAAPLAAAALEHCVTGPVQSERSISIDAEISAIPHASRMAIRIEIQERLPEAALFHTVDAPGLGVWREADRGVSSYKYLSKVTNLSAPAVYRAAVDFRWLNGSGHQVKKLERHTSSCTQTAS